MRRYQEELSSGYSEAEVERLRVLAEFLFQAIADHNLKVSGHLPLHSSSSDGGAQIGQSKRHPMPIYTHLCVYA